MGSASSASAAANPLIPATARPGRRTRRRGAPGAPAAPLVESRPTYRKQEGKKKKKKDKAATDQEHTFSLTNLKAMYSDAMLCDVVFTVQGQDFLGIRSVMALQSPVLRGILFSPEVKGPLSATNRLMIPIEEADPLVFKLFLDFLHTGQISIPCRFISGRSLIPALLDMSRRFEVPSLTEALGGLKEDDIDADNILNLMLLAKRYGDVELLEDCMHFIKYFADVMFKDKNFIVGLPKEVLTMLLASDELGAKEDTLVNAIVRWGQFKIDSGEEKMELSEVVKDFIPFVRLPLVSGAILNNLIAPLGLVEEEQILKILCYQIDKKNYRTAVIVPAARKKPKMKRILKKKAGVKALISKSLENMISISVDGSVAAPYAQTHDGGACVVGGYIFAHYGNDGSGGNRIYAIDIESGASTMVDLPFPTHGSYPCHDGGNYVYVFEDSDSAHGNGFGRIAIDGLTFERLPDAPAQHLRYSSCCVQGRSFWKLTSDYRVAQFDIDAGTWSTKASVSNPGILMADPYNEDIIWVQFQGQDLSRFSISENTFTTASTSGTYFNLGANYPCFLVPGEDGNVFIASFASSAWNVFDSSTSTWHAVSGYPGVVEGGHCMYDSESGRMYFQSSGGMIIVYAA